MKVALIDGDPILYTAAYRVRDKINRDNDWKPFVRAALWDVLTDIMHGADCTHYRLALSAPDNFRKEGYKVAVYKGNREPKQPWFIESEVFMSHTLIKEANALVIHSLEADDLVSLWAREEEFKNEERIVCSPDKDVLQIPGEHYNYNKRTWTLVNETQAFFNLCKQILSGDSTDNVKGIPGMGEYKAHNYLVDNENDPEGFRWWSKVYEAYVKYYGEYYGKIILKETDDAIRLLSYNHSLYHEYRYFQNSRLYPPPTEFKRPADSIGAKFLDMMK